MSAAPGATPMQPMQEPGVTPAPELTPPPGLRLLFVPTDSAARSVGADELADVLAAPAEAAGLTLVRNGSWGLLWLEPLVEVMSAEQVRYAFGPLTQADVP